MVKKNKKLIFFLFYFKMGRKRIYATLEEAYQAKLERARARYHQRKTTEQRKKWGFINMVITQDMVGKTIKDLHDEYKERTKNTEQIEKIPNQDEPEEAEPPEEDISDKS